MIDQATPPGSVEKLEVSAAKDIFEMLLDERAYLGARAMTAEARYVADQLEDPVSRWAPYEALSGWDPTNSAVFWFSTKITGFAADAWAADEKVAIHVSQIDEILRDLCVDAEGIEQKIALMRVLCTFYKFLEDCDPFELSVAELRGFWERDWPPELHVIDAIRGRFATAPHTARPAQVPGHFGV